MRHLSVFLLLLLFLSSVDAQPRVKVFVGEIKSGDKAVAATFRKLLAKELGKLKFIEVVKGSAEAELVLSGRCRIDIRDSGTEPGVESRLLNNEETVVNGDGTTTVIRRPENNSTPSGGYSTSFDPVLSVTVTAPGSGIEFTCERSASTEALVVKEVLNDIKKQLNWPGAKVDESSEIRTKSGEVLKGEIQGTAVQSCRVNRKPSEEVLTSLTLQTGGLRVTLKKGSTAELLRSSGVIVRLTNGSEIRSIDEEGVKAKPDRSLFLLLPSPEKAVSTEAVLSGLRRWLDEPFSTDEPRNALSGVTVEGPLAMAFAADAKPLNQSNCRLEGTMRMVAGGTVGLLPVIVVRTNKGLQSIPISDVAEKRKPQQ